MLCLAFCIPLTACGSAVTPSGKEEIIDIDVDIDIDLTTLSSTMVYAEVSNIVASPEDYLGKSVKMEGICSIYRDEASGKNYYACIIQDATACCAQGIEFVLNESYKEPEDYPEEGEPISVTGVFETYQEGQYTYCILKDAVLNQN